MKTLKFECRLLSDVILNQKSATEGSNNTLDFIPGNVFLGIVATHYDQFGDDAWTVFHSGQVRFGDAHPSDGAHPDVRSLNVPAMLFYPKMKSLSECCYVHCFYDRSADMANNGRPQQLKQCRKGFYVFDHGKGIPVVTEKSFALKSAYDYSQRRSKDENMYGYESLNAGLRFLFEVQVDDGRLAEPIVQYLEGRHYIGRSRTAQYGLVEITRHDYADVASADSTFTLPGCEGSFMTVYADGRLIFLDDRGEPTFTPTAHDLGLNGQIDWIQSQVRIFQYAPWNGKRATRDAERVGIEKGSVFVVRVSGSQQVASRYVGVYRNEGFGRVIYNPPFLAPRPGTNGLASIEMLSSVPPHVAPICGDNILQGSLLLCYIQAKRHRHEAQQTIYAAVNNFVRKYGNNFRGQRFASQWGQIRTIAMTSRTYEAISDALFGLDRGYLCHGVAAEQWQNYGRRDALKCFVDDMWKSASMYVCEAVVNLASEMAKNK